MKTDLWDREKVGWGVLLQVFFHTLRQLSVELRFAVVRAAPSRPRRAMIKDTATRDVGKQVGCLVWYLVHLLQDAPQVGGKLVALWVRHAMEYVVDANARDRRHDKPELAPFLQCDVECLDETGWGDEGGLPLEEPQHIRLVVASAVAHLCIEPQGQPVHDKRNILWVPGPPCIQQTAVAESAQAFRREKKPQTVEKELHGRAQERCEQCPASRRTVTDEKGVSGERKGEITHTGMPWWPACGHTLFDPEVVKRVDQMKTCFVAARERHERWQELADRVLG